MSEVIETNMIESEFVVKATKILKDEAVYNDLLRSSVKTITAYPYNQLPCRAYRILDDNRKLELIGTKFQEIVNSGYCKDVIEVGISIMGRNWRKKPAASAWIQLGDSFHCWELYLWDKDLGTDYLVLVDHGSTSFSHIDADLRYTLEFLIWRIFNHRYGYYIPL